jgi:Pyruvate/2-oxoacid:ferredoxin oxidoreductase delta subunit
MKVMRKIIEIDDEKCDGCGQCVPGCAEGALQIIDGKARMVAEKFCDGLGACLGECPNDALRIIEREAEEFDEQAVEIHLAAQQGSPIKNHSLSAKGGCPSAAIQTHGRDISCQQANIPSSVRTVEDGCLSHWPIQIRLVPPDAPFLKGADLLVAADCTPASYPLFHRQFVNGRVVMMGCPKFDQVPEYIDKFTRIFRQAGIRSVTVLVMEVPCCSGMPMIVKKAMQAAGVDIPVSVATVSTKGRLLELRKLT